MNAPKPTMTLYSRPWTVELNIALEEHWRSAGADFQCEHLTQHAEAAMRLTKEGRKVHFLTAEVAALDIPDPLATLTAIEGRPGSQLRPLNRYRMAERYFWGTDADWQLDQLARYAAWLDRYFKETRPFAIVGETPDVLPVWLAYDLAREHGANVVAMVPSVVPPDRVCPLSDYAELPGAKERYEELLATGLQDSEREQGRAARNSAPYGAALSYLRPRTGRDRVRDLISGRFVRNQIEHNRAQAHERRAGNWFIQPRTAEWMTSRAFSKVRARLAERQYLTAPLPTRPFLFFPLHFQPEASTLVSASYFINQIEVINNIARSVPIGWEVAVKEHFWMRGQRPLSFYRQLAEIPNVSLTSLDVPTEELIDGAEVVSVITSNAGLEAALRGAGVLTFGEVPWGHAPTVRAVGPLPQLPETILSAADAALDPDDDSVLAFAAAWDDALPRARYYEHPEMGWNEPDNVARIAAAIESRISSPVPHA